MNIYSARNFWLCLLLLVVSFSASANTKYYPISVDIASVCQKYHQRCSCSGSTCYGVEGSTQTGDKYKMIVGGYCGDDQYSNPADDGACTDTPSNEDSNGDGNPDSSSMDEHADPDGDGEPNKTDTDDNGNGINDSDEHWSTSPTAISQTFPEDQLDNGLPPSSYVDDEGYLWEQTGIAVGNTASYDRTEYVGNDSGGGSTTTPAPPTETTTGQSTSNNSDGSITKTTETSGHNQAGRFEKTTSTTTNSDGSSTRTTITKTHNGTSTTTTSSTEGFDPNGVSTGVTASGSSYDNKDGNGNGQDDEGEESEGSASGYANCSSPPQCDGDPIYCAILENNWRDRCKKDQTYTASNDCQNPPPCDGDPIQCGSVIESWKLRCVFDFDKDKALKDFKDGLEVADSDADGVIDAADTDEINIGDAFDVGSVFSVSDPFTSSCPAPQSSSLSMGGSVTLDWYPVCELATAMRALVIAMGAFLASLIIYKGLTD
jgi:hypothetical protein